MNETHLVHFINSMHAAVKSVIEKRNCMQSKKSKKYLKQIK